MFVQPFILSLSLLACSRYALFSVLFAFLLFQVPLDYLLVVFSQSKATKYRPNTLY